MTTDATRAQLLERTLEIERSVLGGILADADRLHDAQEYLRPADFGRAAHVLIFETMTRLAAESKPIDLVALKHALTAEQLEHAGGPGYLAGLLDGTPRGVNVGYYASVVRDRATLRAIATTANRMLLAAESGDDDASSVLEEAERAIFALRDRSTRVDVVSPRKRAAATWKQIDALASGGTLHGVSTGLKDLDADLRGLHPGNLIVLAARPSMGKTALGLTFAVNAATHTSQPALLFSLEMSGDEVNLREVMMRSQLNGWRLSHGWMSELEQRRLGQAIEEMGEGGVHVVDAPLLTVGQMSAISRRMKLQHGLSVIVVDYLQLLTAESRRGEKAENRTIELGAMTRAIKGLARDLQVPIVVLSQLSRAVETRADKRPQLADLRESGAIEQDADVVLLLCRPGFYRDFKDKYPEHYCEVNIAKQRNGPTGLVKVAFFREQTRFGDYTEETAA